MPSRVGITQDPIRRRGAWKSKVIGFRNWRVLMRFPTKAEAQAFEDDYAKVHHNVAYQGGRKGKGGGDFIVYRFDYTRNKNDKGRAGRRDKAQKGRTR